MGLPRCWHDGVRPHRARRLHELPRGQGATGDVAWMAALCRARHSSYRSTAVKAQSYSAPKLSSAGTGSGAHGWRRFAGIGDGDPV